MGNGAEQRERATGYADEWTADVQDAIIESIFSAGDISRVAPEAQAKHYDQTCRSMGLNPATMPLMPMRLNGKLVLYPTRGATDQLAAIHRINREIIDGPRITEINKTSVAICVCRATHPNGRTETAIATLPVSDPAMLYMKLETKAKRRATLSILGLGMLDESVGADIPAREKAPAVYGPAGVQPAGVQPAPTRDTSAATVDTVDANDRPVEYTALDKLRDDLMQLEGPSIDQLVGVWLDHKDAIATMAGGEVETIDRAMGEVRARFQAELSQNAFNNAVRAAEMRKALPAFKDFCDTLAHCKSAADVVEAWKAHKDHLAPLSQSERDFAWRMAYQKAGRLDPSLKQPGVWLKNAIDGKQPPPRGGKAPPTSQASNDVADPERAAIEAEGGQTLPPKGSTAYEAALTVDDAAWRLHLMGDRDMFAVSGSWKKRERSFARAGVAKERQRAALERLQALTGVSSELILLSMLGDPKRHYAGRAA